jgi:hypothetical protein
VIPLIAKKKEVELDEKVQLKGPFKRCDSC